MGFEFRRMDNGERLGFRSTVVWHQKGCIKVGIPVSENRRMEHCLCLLALMPHEWSY